MKRFISLIMTLVLIVASLAAMTSCATVEPVGTGASSHLGERTTEGRELRFVRISVNGYGSIIVLLEASTAPETVSSFLELVNKKYYDGLKFHRVIESFMIQGGMATSKSKQAMLKNVKGEFIMNGVYNDLWHVRGTISLARADAYDSGSGQFFITNADSPHLNMQYAGFGYVIAGMSVVDAITFSTAKPNYSNGVIPDERLMATIGSIREITAEEAWGYVTK